MKEGLMMPVGGRSEDLNAEGAMKFGQFSVFILLVWLAGGAILRAYQIPIARYFDGNPVILNAIGQVYSYLGLAMMAACIASFLVVLVTRLKVAWGR